MCHTLKYEVYGIIIPTTGTNKGFTNLTVFLLNQMNFFNVTDKYSLQWKAFCLQSEFSLHEELMERRTQQVQNQNVHVHFHSIIVGLGDGLCADARLRVERLIDLELDAQLVMWVRHIFCSNFVKLLQTWGMKVFFSSVAQPSRVGTMFPHQSFQCSCNGTHFTLQHDTVVIIKMNCLRSRLSVKWFKSLCECWGWEHSIRCKNRC